MPETKPWDGVIPEDELEIYRLSGWGHPGGFGRKAALLIIDIQYRTAGTRPMPIREALQEFSTSCGAVAWDAIGHIQPLLATFRELRLPVIYPHVAPKKTHDGGRFATKVPGIMQIPPKGYEIVAELAPQDGDILLPKNHPSAFFGTALLSYLIDMHVDTLVVTGCSTSGCVRSTVVDAFSYNLRSIVPQDCIYDRSRVSHAVNLFDMAQKYADVMPARAVAERLRAAGHAP